MYIKVRVSVCMWCVCSRGGAVPAGRAEHSGVPLERYEAEGSESSAPGSSSVTSGSAVGKHSTARPWPAATERFRKLLGGFVHLPQSLPMGALVEIAVEKLGCLKDRGCGKLQKAADRQKQMCGA